VQKLFYTPYDDLERFGALKYMSQVVVVSI